MSTTLGEDWRSFFNMVFCDWRKPNFFKGEAAMYEADPNVINFKGKPVSELKEDSKNVTYLEGNSEMLNEYLKQKYNKDQPQVAFFGDQYTSDVHWSNGAHANWHGIAVIEEMMFQEDFEGVSHLEPLDHQLIPYTKYWGECYFIHSKDDPKKNWYVDQLSKNARYAVPLIRHINNFIDH